MIISRIFDPELKHWLCWHICLDAVRTRFFCLIQLSLYDFS